ncbi:MAG: hypothetical protein F6K08_16875 [Okeania sp. SIO1H6]|nr:hypothetical protein [Okeania sp. SIO1H6]
MSRASKNTQKPLKQISISVPEYMHRILVFLTEVTGKSQSAICSPLIEGGLAEEFRNYQEMEERMKNAEILDEEEQK